MLGYHKALVVDKAARAGFEPGMVAFDSISRKPSWPTAADQQDCLARINAEDFDCILPLDEASLKFLTGKTSIRKWHLSPLDSHDYIRCRKVMPSFHPEAIQKEFHLNLYLEMALLKVKRFYGTDAWPRKQKNFILGPSADEAIAILESIRAEEWHSLDIETGNNQINTFGIAWTPTDAVAIKILPEDMSAAAHKKLWDLIGDLCESDSKKVMQNGIYERMYLSAYGITVNNFAHDTMCAMRFLYPELEKGLDNVGRIYTNEPYWKDDGKIHTAEGIRKDWNNVRDWSAHLLYNICDTQNTLEAAFNQRDDLRARGTLTVYDNYVVKLFDPVYEMCARGLPINLETQKKLIAEYEAKVSDVTASMTVKINHRSSKQKIALFKAKGVELPSKKNKQTGKYSESADELALKKARLKNPNDPDLKALLEVSGIEKALSSYLRVGSHPDQRIRYTLDAFATETGRMACKKDVWDMGFNAQTLTDYTKSMIEWKPEDNRIFVEIDLSQAESRFVALDAQETTLMGMIERKEDIHRFVAAEIYQKPMAEITHEERQLGKKSGHGANYAMGANTFMDSCLKEMDLVIDKKMATRVLESYHKLFPQIRKWHEQINNEVTTRRKLTNPLGLERYFYGRVDSNTMREAYAYRPQSTIPMVTNHLILALCEQRKLSKLKFELFMQVHDSCILACAPQDLDQIAEFALNTDLWHPEIILPGGRLVIPTDIKVASNLGKAVKYGTETKV